MAPKPAPPLARTPSWRRKQVAIDVGAAVAVFGLELALLSAGGDAPSDGRGLDPLGVLLAALASLPLIARRRAPLAVFAVTAAASAVLNGLGYPPGPPIGPTVALYFLALAPENRRAPRWLAGLVVGALLLVHAGAVGIADDAFPTVPLLYGALVWGGALVIGDRVRQRRARVAELEEQVRRAERDAERERRLAAAEERTRIARDLHDSAGHAINVILVQAGAARLLARKDPERAHAALETIEEVARETLGEIDQLVRALRDDDAPGSGVEPAPGLAALDTLADRHRSAGLAIDIRLSGARRQLPPALDQAAYRILQEALTNSARHGDGRAEVEIAYGSSALELGVVNAVREDSPPPGSGHGLVGMRERAALLGGSVETDASKRRFCVRALLPYGGGA